MGARAMRAQTCFVSPTHPPLKQNILLFLPVHLSFSGGGNVGSEQTYLWICIQLLVRQPISLAKQSKQTDPFESPFVRAEKEVRVFSIFPSAVKP